MALLHWRDEFNTGIPSVDYEHQQLFDMINALHRTLDAGDMASVDEFLAALHDRIAAHFALEERVMRQRAYAGYAEHKTDHERLLDEIRDLMEASRAGDYRSSADVLAQQLERWFSVHFQTLDVRLHRAVGDVAPDPSGHETA
jgi:hemerythrin-like metal-binding protein